MRFVDIVTIFVKAGHGGQGAVSFRREKYVSKGGPDGGKGGQGGHIILHASLSVQTLMDLKIKHEYKAKNGNSGGKKDQSGAHGKDTIIRVPCGTMVFDKNKKLIGDLKGVDETLIVAKGGMGGLGNASFSTSRNQVPRHAQPGMPGEEKHITLELRMIADVGLVGFPNAGKSTLLKVLTKANPKIAAYPFTTLFPNLGVIRYLKQEIVIADIPGLIKGASKGQGLGDEFLRHIDRTRLLLHMVDVSSDTPATCFKQFETIQKEIAHHNLKINKKPMIVVLTKTDIINENDLTKIIGYFKKKKVSVLTISSLTNNGIETLKQEIQENINKIEIE